MTRSNTKLIESTGSDSTNLKEEISKILMNAVNGSEDRYLLDGKYIRWGLVEREIHAAIDKNT